MLDRLFGRRSPSSIEDVVMSGAGGEDDRSGEKKEGKKQDGYRWGGMERGGGGLWEDVRGSGFDPTGLERAARAARQLDRSRFAADALEAIKMQEVSRQFEHKRRVAEYEAYTKREELKQVEVEADEARKTLRAQAEHERQKAQYADKLERKRYADEMNARRYMKEEELKKQEELTRRQEEMKRKTLEYEAELRRKTELARVKAETEGKIRQERENHDLHLQQTRLEAEERRQTGKSRGVCFLKIH